ncbi:MAG TPA: hypothetical protein VFA55_03070 [Candidatus Kapabacteria bacterium]|nr:hypothetical protein [Candidatus Kapabacteria bacterium]
MSAAVCSFLAGCAPAGIPLVNDLPEGTTLGKILAHHKVIMFDSTAIAQAVNDMLPQANNAAQHYVTEDSPSVAGIRNILIDTWNKVLADDSVTVSVQHGKGITADTVTENCGAYTGDYVLVFDSVVIQSAFPPGASSQEAQQDHTEQSPAVPPPPAVTPPGPVPPTLSNLPPEPPQPIQFGPAYISCYLSVIRLGDCRKILTLQTGTDVFELSDTNKCAERVKQAAMKALETTHESPTISPVGEWN